MPEYGIVELFGCTCCIGTYVRIGWSSTGLCMGFFRHGPQPTVYEALHSISIGVFISTLH